MLERLEEIAARFADLRATQADPEVAVMRVRTTIGMLLVAGLLLAPGCGGGGGSTLEAGAPCTWFLPDTDPQGARKRWIAAMKPRGQITVDAGAARALSPRPAPMTAPAAMAITFFTEPPSSTPVTSSLV